MEMIAYAFLRLLLETVVPGLLRSQMASNWFLAGTIFLAVVLVLFRRDVRDVVLGSERRELLHETQRRLST